MSVSPGEEFKLKAVPDAETRRKLEYLAQIGSEAVLAGNVADRGTNSPAARRAAAAERTADMIRMARLADPAYQAMSVRINEDLDRMDERAVDTLQRIEHALIELRLKRERLLEQTYRDPETGRPIAMTRDGAAAYYVESRERLDDEAFLQVRGKLIGGPVIEEFDFYDGRINALGMHRDRILAGITEGDQLRDDLNAGAISKDEAERRSQEIQQSASAALNDAETALLSARSEMPRSGDNTVDPAFEEITPVTAPPIPR